MDPPDQVRPHQVSILLAADTSGKHGSIALARCGPGDSCAVLEVVPLAGGTFSAQLVPQVARLLEKHGIDKTQIDAFAVASGPGSFTGLRVGLAAIKALAEVLAKPVAAVSLLEAVAAASSLNGRVVAALDAGRGEVYAGGCQIHGGVRLLSERLLTQQEFLEFAVGAAVVSPDEAVAAVARSAGLSVQEIARPLSDAVARLGWRKILSGDITSAEALDANYIRCSDADIFSSTALQSGKKPDD